MLPDYADIRSRIAEQPTWYDGNGVPRYGAFKPENLGVYDVFAVLVEIECQSCTRLFLVGEGYPRVGFYWGTEAPITWSLNKILDRYHYGDPPNHGCVGDTMNCIDRRVVEAWQLPSIKNLSEEWRWVRASECEGRSLTPEWAEEVPPPGLSR